MDQEINDVGNYVFGIYNQFMKKLDETFENKIDSDGRNIIDYTSIAVKLTIIAIGVVDKNRG